MADLSRIPKDKRACWECNPRNEDLKSSEETLRCILCWRRFRNGEFLDEKKRQSTKA